MGKDIGSGDLAARYGQWGLVAGASVGLGAAMADAAAAAGLDVVLVARRGNVMRELAARLSETHGCRTRCIEADLADDAAIDRIAAQTADLEIGVVVYNAAAQPRGPFLTETRQELLRAIAVNCTAPTLLCHHFGRLMAERKRGAIALVGSLGSLQGSKVYVEYFASKAYEWILGEGLWSELRDQGIDVVSYVLGATATPEVLGLNGVESLPTGTDHIDIDDPMALAKARLAAPTTPAAAAHRLMARLHAGPTQFSTDADEKLAASMSSLSRRDVVEMWSTILTDAYGPDPEQWRDATFRKARKGAPT
jgi:short-subunit dehydrogenase